MRYSMHREGQGTTMDFTLSLGQCRLVAKYRQKIQDLFRVAVQLPDLMATSAAGVGGSSSAPVWVEISGEKERATKARTYMLSLCSVNEVVERFPADVLDNLDLLAIENCTQAALTRISPEELRIQGDQMIIVTATSLLYHKHQQYKQQREECRRLSGNHGNSVMGISTMQQELNKVNRIEDVVSDYGMTEQSSKEMSHKSDGFSAPYKEDHLDLNAEKIDVVVPPRTYPVDSSARTVSPNEEIVIVPPPRNQPSSETIEIITPRNPPIMKDTDLYIQTTSCSSDINQEADCLPKRPLVAHGGSCSPSTRSTVDDIEACTDSPIIDAIDPTSTEVLTTNLIGRQTSFDRNPLVETETLRGTLDLLEKPQYIRQNSQDPRTDEPHEMMQKLGFSKGQVDHIIQQLGPNASRNDILGALVSQNKSANTDLERIAPPCLPGERLVRDVSDSTAMPVVKDEADNLRTIIIDGSNVAMSFGNKDVFACKGIEIVVNWFLERGHRVIHVFVPTWRKEAAKPDTPITDQHILQRLEKLKIVIFTPSRRINGRRVVCYDDRYIIKTAVDFDGIVVSNDNFRDLQNEKQEFKKIVEERLLMYSFVGNQFMPPDDPLGRHGPSLDNFLRIRPTAPDHPPQTCPYGKKCTYGNKCKFYHPERQGVQKPISQKLKEQDESRKRAQLNAILEDYQSDDFKGYHNVSMHNGVHTEPIPRPPRFDHDAAQEDHSRTGPLPGYRGHPGSGVTSCNGSESGSNPNLEAGYRYPSSGVSSHNGSDSGSNPNLESVGAGASARQFVPYTVSGYGREHYNLPPPHIHGTDPGRYFTEPLPRPASPQVDIRGSGTVPLANVPRHVRSSAPNGAVPRHSSLPPDSGAGLYRGLQEEIARLTIGGASPAQHQDTGYPGQNRPLPYGGGGYHDSQSAPLPHPDQMRNRRTSSPSYQPQPYPSNYGNGSYGNSQSSNHPGGHHHHPSAYPTNPGRNPGNQWSTSASLPPQMPHTNHPSMYPNLPGANQEERHHTYPNEQRRSQPGIDTSPSLAQRRKNFLRNHKSLYTEDIILEVFKKYPNETNEQRLHQRIQHYLRF